jgi:hypothetical protein
MSENHSKEEKQGYLESGDIKCFYVLFGNFRRILADFLIYEAGSG